MISSRLSSFLTNSTALVGVGSLVFVLAVIPIHNVQSKTINGTVAPQSLSNGDTLNITSTGVVRDTDYPASARYTGGPIGAGVFIDGSSIKGINNDGEIIGGYGIQLGSGDRIRGDIRNTGLIKADFKGILLQKSEITGDIYNSGTMKAGNLQSGQTIVVRNESTVGNIVNAASGVLSATGGAGNVYISNSTVKSLINHGSIVGGAGALDLANVIMSKGITNTGLLSGGRGVWIVSGNFSGNIFNSGVINGDRSDGLGLSSVTVAGSITNAGGGIIRATGVNYVERDDSEIDDDEFYYEPGPSIYDGKGSAISLNHVTMSKGINNAGLIEGQVTGIITDGTTIYGVVVNSGTIKGEKGIQFSDGALVGGLRNSGTIEGTGGTAIQLSELDANSTLSLNGGRVIGDIIDEEYENNFSHIVIGGNFVTEGNITVSDLVVNNGKIFSINTGNTVSIMSMPKSAGTFNFMVKDATSHGQLKVTGAGEKINLEGSKVTVTGVSSGLRVGDELLVAEGNAQVVGLDGGAGQTSETVDDNLILVNFEFADGSQSIVTESNNNQNLYLVVTQGEAIEGIANKSNEKLAEIINNLAGSSDAAIQKIWDALNGARTEEDVNQILDSLKPDVSGGEASTAEFTMNTSLNITSNRLVAIRSNGLNNSGISSGDVSEGLQVWVQGFGELASQSERGGVSGFDLNSFGVTGGVDSEKIMDDAVFGVAFGYSMTNVDSNGTSHANTDIESYHMTLYGDYDLDQNTYLNTMLAYAYHENEGSRVPVAGLLAKSDYAAHQFVARLEAGHSYQLGSTILTPNVMGQFAHYNPDSYMETGAGGANLSVDMDSTNIAELGAGLDASWFHAPKSGGEIETTLGVQYRYDFIGDAVSTTTSLTGGGSAISSQGFDPAQGTVVLGAGVRYQLNDSWDVSAQYDYEYKSDYRAHTGLVRASYSF